MVKKKQNEIIRDLLKAFKTNEGLALFICEYVNNVEGNYGNVRCFYSKDENSITLKQYDKDKTYVVSSNDYWKLINAFIRNENIMSSDELRIWIDLNMYKHKDEFNLVE